MTIHKQVRVNFKLPIKVFLLSVFLFLIYKRIHDYLTSNPSGNFEATLNNVSHYEWLMLIFAVMLMPINWILESMKWRYIMNAEGSIKTKLVALRVTMAGVFMGFVTPLGSGDYIGRILLLRSEERPVSVYATFVSSIFQNIVNIGVGLCGLSMLWVKGFSVEIELKSIIGINVVIITLGVLLILKVEKFANCLLSISYIQKYLGRVRIKMLNAGDKLMMLALTLLRYAVYVIQYLFILNFFSVDTSTINLIIGITTIFLIQSTVPLPAVLGFLARAELAILIWSIFDVNVMIALSATICLWVINLLLPAFIGMIITFKNWR